MKKIVFLFLLGFVYLWAVDIDNDLVPDEIDQCLDTPAGVFVNKIGCTQEIVRVVSFEHNSFLIDLQNTQQLQEHIELSKEAFGYRIIIKGHTDSSGDYQSNIALSKKRAYMVLKQFESFGIDKERISIKWYGETIPIATNVTPQGRAMNRRVEIVFK